MGIVLALLAALSYGAGDFLGGLGSRRVGAGSATVVVQFVSLVAAGIAVLLFPADAPTANALAWGAVSGAGSGIGTLALYRGLAIGQMSVVAPLSAVITAVLPVIIGLLLGEHLSVPAQVGICAAVPAIALVSWRRTPTDTPSQRTGIIEGVLSGVGFAVLFIALDRAGTDSGAWPLVPGQAVALVLVLPFGLKTHHHFRSWTSTTSLIVAAGLLSGAANLLFLAATHHGQLSIVAVLTALYPAVTILLARVILGERWNAFQVVGLGAAAAAVALISTG